MAGKNETFSRHPEFPRRLADDQQGVQRSIDGLIIRREAVKVHSSGESLDARDILKNVVKTAEWPVRRQERSQSRWRAAAGPCGPARR